MTYDELAAFLSCAPQYPSTTQERRNHFLPKQAYKPAAVLLAIVWENSCWQILLTRRTNHLRHHNGQIALPGGRTEPQDLSPAHTALRETQEEVGIDAQCWQTFPALAPHYSPSGYEVRPIPAVCTATPALKLNPEEVAEAFYLPLETALNLNNYASRALLNNQGHTLQTPTLPYLHYDIWGLTAVILYSFAERYRQHIIEARPARPSEKHGIAAHRK